MSNLQIKTTQNINLFFRTASIGERMFAYFIDFLILISYVIVVLVLLSYVFSIDVSNLDGDAFSLALLLISLPIMFYSLICEATMEGQTFGKKLLKIKVVKIDGYQASFFDYFVRWVFAIVDIQMAFVPGVISMVVTTHTQRLGDLAAGTAVITEKNKYSITQSILMEVADDYQPYFSRNQVMLFTDNDIRIVKENYELSKRSVNKDLLLKISSKLCAVLQISNPFSSHQTLIETLLKDYNFHTAK